MFTLDTSTMHVDKPRQTLDGLLLFRLSRLLSTGGGMVTRLCEGRFGITRREWRLLATLAGHGELGSSLLAEHAQLDRARTSKAVGSMIAKQLVQRVLQSGDRRQVRLRLTAAGEKLYDELFPLVAQINADIISVLKADDARLLDPILLQLQAQAERLVDTAVWPKADRGRHHSTSPQAPATPVSTPLA